MREPGSDQENSDGDSAQEGSSRRPDKKLRRSRLSVFEVSEIAVGKGIKPRTWLLALANKQKQEGKTDLTWLKILQKAKEGTCSD